MNKVNEFLRHHFVNDHVCVTCGRHFPASVIITLDSHFPEIAGKYCTVCYHKIYDQIGFCDECGNEYPKKYLYSSMLDKTVVCKECLQYEENTSDC